MTNLDISEPLDEWKLPFADNVLSLEAKGMEFSEEKYHEIIPYTKTRSEKGDNKGETQTAQFKINPDIARLITEFIQRPDVPYKTPSDFYRDAIYKWLRKCWLRFDPLDTKKYQFFMREDSLLKHARHLEHLMTWQSTLQVFFNAMEVYLKENTALSIAQATKELRWWVGTVEGMRDAEPYFHEKYARALVTNAHVKRLYRYLLDTNERDKVYVTILDKWSSEYSKEPERVMVPA